MAAPPRSLRRLRTLRARSFGEAVSATVLARILMTHHRLAAEDGQLVLCGLQPHVADLMTVTGFNDLLTICATPPTCRWSLLPREGQRHLLAISTALAAARCLGA